MNVPINQNLVLVNNSSNKAQDHPEMSAMTQFHQLSHLDYKICYDSLNQLDKFFYPPVSAFLKGFANSYLTRRIHEG